MDADRQHPQGPDHPLTPPLHRRSVLDRGCLPGATVFDNAYANVSVAAPIGVAGPPVAELTVGLEF